MKQRTRAIPNRLMRQQREKRHWTQTELARMLGATYLSVCRWENGTTTPSLYYRKQLCEIFQLSAEELGLTSPSVEATTSSEPQQPSLSGTTIWNVPYRRNPFFTGRDYFLARLQALLSSSRAAAVSQAQAISGLGGIGKTQTAIEYAYRYRNDYQAVLWARAEHRDVLYTDLVGIATLLNLLEQGEQDATSAIKAVKSWLGTHSGWLFILDNVEDLALIDEVMPVEAPGHLLLTTRAQSTGTLAQRLDLEQMDQEEGAFFLLRRAKLLGPDAPLQAAPQSTIQQAYEVCTLLGGLPLALDQAGAYVEETGCSLADYLQHYQARHADLLRRRGQQVQGHPQSVSTTVSLCVEKVAPANPAALDLLRLCAFLEPDAIPEEIITDGAPELGPALVSVATDPLSFDAAMADLRRYSLLRRNPEHKILTIHRLVQAVLKESMDEQTQQLWRERAVRAMDRIFPEGEFATWERCKRCLPQVQACAVLIERYNLSFPEAGQLLNKAGWYLVGRALYTLAEPLLQRALTISEQALGPDHADTASPLNNLAVLAFYQGRYEQAEPLLHRALTLRERVLGPEHPETASTLDTLALVYYYQGKYAQAEPLYLHALAIEEKALGPEHLDTGATLNNLALLYQAQGRYEQAEPLYLRVLDIHRKTLGSEHPYTAIALDNLAKLYYTQGRYQQAEPLYQQALMIEEKVLGLEHTSTAITISNLGQIYHAQGRYEQAESLYQRALAIQEKVLGPENAAATYVQVNLARLCQDLDRLAEAESLYRRALDTSEKTLGGEHPQTATILDHLAQLYRDQGQEERAGQLFLQVLNIRRQRLGAEHPDTVATREHYNALLEKKTERGRKTSQW